MPTGESDGNATAQPKTTPLPKLQFFVLLLLQAAEPITVFVVFPFITQLIYEYGLTNGDEKKIGYYAGTINSLFFLTEMVFVVYWGRLSDRIGRRPVLLTGLFGLFFSSFLFGVSKTFLTLALSRALSGALNGNVGVMKSMMAEITDETNQAFAFSFMPLIFAVGTSIGSILGGGLSHPYERFPGAFGWSTFWKYYPYALPCFVAASYCVVAFVISYLCLEESLQIPPPGQANESRQNFATTNVDTMDEPPTANTPLISKRLPSIPPSMREILTPRVKIAILNGGTFALLAIVFLFLQPLVLSTPISLGGLGLQTPTIGLILSISGFVTPAIQILVFAPFHRRFGTKRVFIATIISFFIIYLSWPVMCFLAKRAGKVDAWVVLVLVTQQLVNAFSLMGYSCAHIFITSSAPTRNALGVTTGLSQSLVSLTRAVGPAAMTSLFAFSLERNVLGGQLVYLALILLVVLAWAAATMLPDVIQRAYAEHDQ